MIYNNILFSGLYKDTTWQNCKFGKWNELVSLTYCGVFQSVNPILIWVYPRKQGWPDLPHSNSNLSNSHSPSCSIHGILLLQTNTLALLLHLRLPRLHWLSSLALALHFKLQQFSQNMPIIRPVNKRRAIACTHLYTCLMNARRVIHCTPKIYNLSLLVFLSSDFLLFENRSSCFFSFRICRKTRSCGSLWKISCCTWGNQELFLVVPK